MPTFFEQVYIDASARHLPGPAIDNASMDAFVAPLNRISSRIKKRILEENGIRTRHYGIAPDGTTRESPESMAARAIQRCLADAHRSLDEVGMLATGGCAGDALLPGFANMLLGELAGPPMQLLTSQGICASGVAACEAAESAIELGTHLHALVVAAEMPSRLFKRSRYAGCGYDADFDAHFLRWMLSDGAGAVLLSSKPRNEAATRLKLRFIHQRSFSGDYPVCMQLGLKADRSRSHLDYERWQDAENDGALLLRQDIRLLPHLFDVGIHEYVSLVDAGHIDPARIDHFLCHYSSEKFAPVIDELMQKAGFAIPRERWYSNLATRGNTGAASIFIMLDEFLRSRSLQPGERILCFVPESGRFTVSFLLIEVEDARSATPAPPPSNVATRMRVADEDAIPAPHDPAATDDLRLRELLGQLAVTWHDYRSRVWRTPVVRGLREGAWTRGDYLGWMRDWIPQVREGSLWMREGATSVQPPFDALAALIETHAGEEQNDYEILLDDYRKAGGDIADIDQLRRNPGGEALNSYLHALASTPNPVGLLGAIYIIEGTGQRIIPALLPLMKASLKDVPRDAFRFLEYHGENDEHHLLRWLRGVEIVLTHDTDGSHTQAILDTAKRTAELYLMQFQHVTAINQATP